MSSPTRPRAPDLIDANICANSPAIVARKTYSQLLKLLLPTAKKASCTRAVGYSRSGSRKALGMFVRRTAACSFHRTLASLYIVAFRLHTANVFEHYLQLQQTGGMRGISVTLGVHQARSYLRTRLRQHKCVGFLFLDLTEAFYRIVRQLALGGPPDDEAIAAVGERLHLWARSPPFSTSTP